MPSANPGNHQPDLELHSLSLAYETYMRHDEDEKNHFEGVCSAYRQYAAFAMAHYANQQYRFHSLPESQRAVLPERLKRGTADFEERAAQFRDSAIRNQFCLDSILRHAGTPHSQEIKSLDRVVDDGQISKVSSVLKSLARDWSEEGKTERDIAYTPIIEQIRKYLPVSDFSSRRPRICVPGAGVGRLAFELTKLNYCVQGNDFSLYMLLASDFILNGRVASPDRPLQISPYLLESRNTHRSVDPLRSVTIPDVDPLEMLSGDEKNASFPDFSMAAGEFLSIYNQPKEAGRWDCVASCFFLDACPNVVETLQLIHRMLKPGGLLVNFGPLLYHWSGPGMRPDDKSYEDYRQRFEKLDQRYMVSVDFPYDDIKEIMSNLGFEMIEEHTGIDCLYTADRRSMMNTMYRCVNFVARKLPGLLVTRSSEEARAGAK